jgi:menaquinone-dependent protoporphyrinogen oxidase
MKVLVVVASKHGSTREIAETIAQELQTELLQVELKAPEEVKDISGYDAVVLGSAIYAGSWLPEAKAFAATNQVALSKMPVWVFSSGPLGAETPQPPPDSHTLMEPLSNVSVRDHQVFVGKLDSKDLGLAEKLIVKAVHAPYGDFRNWEDIRGWARAIATDWPRCWRVSYPTDRSMGGNQ